MFQNKSLQYVKKLVLFFFGLLIIQIGVSLFLAVGLGSDPFTVFSQGIANLLHINIGSANRILTFVLLVVVFFIDRRNINVGTLLCVLFTGMLLNQVSPAINQMLPVHMTLTTRILLFLCGCVTVSVGFPILLSAELGVAPNDLAYLAITDLLKQPYSRARMGMDVIFILIGVLTGGVIGVGTILCIALLGPMTQFFMKPVSSFVETQVFA